MIDFPLPNFNWSNFISGVHSGQGGHREESEETDGVGVGIDK